MTHYRAVIADDEPLLRRHLAQSLAEVWPQLDIVASVADGELALQAIEAHQPEVAFLDIRMPVLDGMSLAQRLNQLPSSPLIVFVTAFDHYAIKAFEENAVDYLLKPISESRLRATCQKVQQRMQQTPKESVLPNMDQLLTQLASLKQTTTPSYLQWIRASRGDDIHLLSVDDIHYFKAEEKYVSVYAKQAGERLEEFLIRTSLRELLQQLDPEQFWQIHRSTVVQVGKIDKVNKDFAGRMFVHVSNGKLAVSRAQQSLFKGM